MSLAETPYDSATKVFTVSDLYNYNLENPTQISFDRITLSFAEKYQFVYVCSSEVAIRKRDPPFVNSGVGNIVTTLHCPQAYLEVSDTVTTSTPETSVT